MHGTSKYLYIDTLRTNIYIISKEFFLLNYKQQIMKDRL